MLPRTEKSLKLIDALRHSRQRPSYRREVALGSLVVAVYLAVFVSSIVALLGGRTPDFLRLAGEVEPQTDRIAEVLAEREPEVPGVPPAMPGAPPIPSRQAAGSSPGDQPPSSTPPGVPQPVPVSVTQATTPSPVVSVSGRHLVQAGETLSLLGVLYHVDVAALKAINGLRSDLIYAGQTLIVPRPDEASRIAVASLGEGGTAARPPLP